MAEKNTDYSGLGKSRSGELGSNLSGNPPKAFLFFIVFAILSLIVIVGGLLLMSSGAGRGSQPSSSGGFKLGGGCVGVINVIGEIAMDDTEPGLIGIGSVGSETIASEIEEAASRSDVKALVVVVDSPGGSPVASRHIYSALKDVKKPKVAYFREMAASGGYYVGAGTDYIVAEPSTLTGSIGVRATFTDLSSLFGKIGYNETTIKSGELKDIGTSSRPMTDKERQLMRAIVQELFDEFKGVVMESRGSRLNMEKFNEVLDARVLTGRQALAAGLVDQLGDKKAAVKKASELAGEEHLDTCEFAPKQKGFFSQLMGDFSIFPKPEQLLPKWQLQY